MSDSTGTLSERLAGVLGEHRLYGEEGDDYFECGCGERTPDEWFEVDFGELIWHEQHQAQALTAVVAKWVVSELADGPPFIPLTCWTPDQEAAAIIAHGALVMTMRRDLPAAAVGEAGR